MRIRCPSCSARLNALPHLAGERVPCPKCGKKVLVPDPDDSTEAETDEEAAPAGGRKLVYVRRQEGSGNDVPGTISLVLFMAALAALGMGWFANGWMYVGSIGIALLGFGLGFMARGSLRITDCSLNFLVLLPAVIVSALHLAGIPVTQRARALANRPIVVEGQGADAPVVEPPANDQPSPGPNWIDASRGEPVKVGSALVKIGDVKLGVSKSVDISKALENLDPDKILQPDNSGAVTEHPALLIEVQVGNPSETIKMELKRWSKARGGESPRLTDNFKNIYKLITSSTDLLSMVGGGSGGSAAVSIMPVQTVADILTFEPPVAKAQYLRLELPAENFGGKGTLYFQIPRSMIQPGR
jgi:hypothetical protein